MFDVIVYFICGIVFIAFIFPSKSSLELFLLLPLKDKVLVTLMRDVFSLYTISVYNYYTHLFKSRQLKNNFLLT